MPALQVRLSEGEYASCKEKARVAGVSMSEWVRGRLFDGEQPSGVPSGPRSPRTLPPRVSVNAPDASPVRRPAVRKRAVPDIGAEVITAEIPEIPAFEELAASIEVVKMPERLAQLPDGTLITESQYEELLVTGNVVVDEYGPILEESPSFPPVGLPEPKLGVAKLKFKRHPKCDTDKCARGLMGPACTLCRMANAISF